MVVRGRDGRGSWPNVEAPQAPAHALAAGRPIDCSFERDEVRRRSPVDDAFVRMRHRLCHDGGVDGSSARAARDGGQPDIAALQMLRHAKDRIDRDYAEALDVASLAAIAGYSPAYFIRAFHAAYGETPGRYRTRRRVERACELLRSVNLTVTEICQLVGFASLGTFSARFTELVGRSPSAYRREAARQGGPVPIPGCFALMWRTGLVASPLDDQPEATS